MSSKLLSTLLVSCFLILILLLQATAPYSSSSNQQLREEIGQIPAITTQAEDFSSGGYTSKVSVMQGETIDFHVSVSAQTYDLLIYREGETRTLMHTISQLPGDQNNCQGGYETGCGWPVAATLQIGVNWPSGVYTVDIITNSGGGDKMVFWVRENDPGSTGKILFLSSVNTYNAYTNFGGKSLYGFNSSDEEPAEKVSFNRPYKNNGSGDYYRWEGKFVSWAEEEGYDLEYATTYDLHFIPDLLSYYDVAVIAGHSEYWSWDMRQEAKQFIQDGGRFLNLSGNTMWWQVRFEDNGRTLVGYKSRKADPVQDPQLVSDYNWEYPIFDTSHTFFGVYFDDAGLFPRGELSLGKGYGGFWTKRAAHWVFAGTNLQNEDIFGYSSHELDNIIEHEADGTTFNCASDGLTIRGPLGNTGTPHNFTILAISPVWRKEIGFATMGIFTTPTGGAVFSGSSIGWSNALIDPQVRQITKNVLDRFLDTNTPMPQEPVSSQDTDYFFYDRFNCSQLENNGISPRVPEWDTLPGHNYYNSEGGLNTAISDVCGFNGSGLLIDIVKDNSMTLNSQVKPNWGKTNVLYMRMYLNFSNFSIADGNIFDFIRKYHDTFEVTPSSRATIQISGQNGSPAIRYKVAGVNSDWVTVPDSGFFLLETMWDKDQNQAAIWINDELRWQKTIDLSNELALNRVDMLLRGVDSGTNGSFCLDEFAFDDARIGPLVEPILLEAIDPVSEIQPGSQVTLWYTLTNNTGQVDSYMLEATAVSPSWPIALTPQQANSLGAGASTTVKLVVDVPADALADTVLTAVIRATSLSDPTASANGIHTSHVAVRPDVSLDQPHTISADLGDTIVLQHEITNQGNLTDNFSLQVQANHGSITPLLSTQTIQGLAPEASDTFTVTVAIPADMVDPADLEITITAVSDTDPQKNAQIVDSILLLSQIEYKIYIPFLINQP
jgi:hypothetical protein